MLRVILKAVESFLRDWHLPGKSELPMKATKRLLRTCTHTHTHTRGLLVPLLGHEALRTGYMAPEVVFVLFTGGFLLLVGLCLTYAPLKVHWKSLPEIVGAHWTAHPPFYEGVNLTVVRAC